MATKGGLLHRHLLTFHISFILVLSTTSSLTTSTTHDISSLNRLITDYQQVITVIAGGF